MRNPHDLKRRNFHAGHAEWNQEYSCPECPKAEGTERWRETEVAGGGSGCGDTEGGGVRGSRSFSGMITCLRHCNGRAYPHAATTLRQNDRDRGAVRPRQGPPREPRAGLRGSRHGIAPGPSRRSSPSNPHVREAAFWKTACLGSSANSPFDASCPRRPGICKVRMNTAIGS